MEPLKWRLPQLLVLLLVAALVPGQQLVGVKSVVSASDADGKDGGKLRSPEADHKGGESSSSGISARSIDKFSNDFPESDSKIINLSIKPLGPRVISGSSSRGARNLGFSADTSLNSIPGTLSNELSNIDLKGAVAQSPSGAKDSYGNPVTPYTELGTTGLDSVGFLTDVNRDALLQPTRSNQIGNFNFKVPSYASGIIEPVLPPYNSPANLVNGQPQSTYTTQATTTPFQFVANAKIPVIDEAPIPFAQVPVNGLLPPLFPGELPLNPNVDINTERSSFFVKDPFGGPQLSKDQSLPFDKPPVDFKAPQGPLQIPLHTPPLNQPQGPNVIQQTPQQPQGPPIRPTQAPVQKFTGSFGGAPGFLGNQQNLGTAYTSTAHPNKPAPPIVQQVPQVPQQQVPHFTQQVPQQPTQKPVPTYTGSFGGASPAQFLPTVRPATAPSTQTVNKFTGSFGGAPGILGSQQNLGTAYKPTTPIPATPQRPVSFQPPPAPSQLPPQTQITSIIQPPTPFQPPPPQHQQYGPQPAKPAGGTYTGGFGFANNNNQHQQPQQPRPQAPQQKPPGQYVGNKFTGSFGGAPGLLGNQKQPGTHVKPDGTILPPSGPGIGAVGGPRPPTQAAASGSTFSGSFGGPPGILRPFDNVQG